MGQRRVRSGSSSYLRKGQRRVSSGSGSTPITTRGFGNTADWIVYPRAVVEEDKKKPHDCNRIVEVSFISSKDEEDNQVVQ